MQRRRDRRNAAGATGTLLAPKARMIGTLIEVLLVALFAVTLLSAAVAVGGRMMHQLHGGPAA